MVGIRYMGRRVAALQTPSTPSPAPTNVSVRRPTTSVRRRPRRGCATSLPHRPSTASPTGTGKQKSTATPKLAVFIAHSTSNRSTPTSRIRRSISWGDRVPCRETWFLLRKFRTRRLEQRRDIRQDGRLGSYGDAPRHQADLSCRSRCRRLCSRLGMLYHPWALQSEKVVG